MTHSEKLAFWINVHNAVMMHAYLAYGIPRNNVKRLFILFKGNKRSAGFTIEERQSFEMNFPSKGFVDTFRNQHPGVVGYTYWGYRHNGRKTNKGWRLDYFLVSKTIPDKALKTCLQSLHPAQQHLSGKQVASEHSDCLVLCQLNGGG